MAGSSPSPSSSRRPRRASSPFSILRGVDTAAPEGWEVVDGALQRTFRFEDFSSAIDFVNRVAEVAEEENHHPDISVRYREVTLRFWTHSERAITERDAALAERTGRLA